MECEAAPYFGARHAGHSMRAYGGEG